jgi:hypothetical protein
LDLAKAGKSIAAKIAMMAITTKSSIRVNPSDRFPVRSAAGAGIPLIRVLLLMVGEKSNRGLTWERVSIRQPLKGVDAAIGTMKTSGTP